jgi:hypothetical protein
VRRAVEELKVAESFHQISRILVAAFDSNDFDAFELCPNLSARGLHLAEGGASRLRWTKPGALVTPEFENAWSLTLDLVSTANRHCGQMIMLRHYSNRDLQLDINLLTSGFAITLADALQRTAAEGIEFEPVEPDAVLFSAQAG